MKTILREKEMLQALRPTDIALYLRAKHWIQDPQSRALGTSARKRSCPDKHGGRGLQPAYRRLVTNVALVEQRSAHSVRRSAHHRIRCAAEYRGSRDACPSSNMHKSLRKQESLSFRGCRACFLATRKPTKAMEHVRRVRIGQSERGSYIVTVLCRVTPLLHKQTNLPFTESEEIFERQVTLMLARSLQALEHAAREAATHQEYAVFAQAIPEGVSANLCDAVAGFWEMKTSNAKSVLSWSPTRPALQRSPRYFLCREQGFKARNQPSPDVDLTGPVSNSNAPKEPKKKGHSLLPDRRTPCGRSS